MKTLFTTLTFVMVSTLIAQESLPTEQSSIICGENSAISSSDQDAATREAVAGVAAALVLGGGAMAKLLNSGNEESLSEPVAIAPEKSGAQADKAPAVH